MTTIEATTSAPRLDMEVAFWLVLYQTDAKTQVSVFQGEEAEKDARDEIARLIKGTKRKVALLGPQRGVFWEKTEAIEVSPSFLVKEEN